MQQNSQQQFKNMKPSEFESRMKAFESPEALRKLDRDLPVCCRIDGKSFHVWTKRLQRPFDSMFMEIMVLTTMSLVEETHALIGYTQSDEISLVWNNATPESQIWFDGRIQKMTSVLSSIATYYFNHYVPRFIPAMER